MNIIFAHKEKRRNLKETFQKQLKKTLFLVLIVVVNSLKAATYERPLVLPLPDSVVNIKQPIVSLNGSWHFTLNPPSDFWKNETNFSTWTPIEVPGEPWMQGLEIERDKEYPYKKTIEIPTEFAEQRLFLQFDGIYSIGKIWVNGTFVGEHYGGFTRWNVEITNYVTAGEEAIITISIMDKKDDLSFASGYASRFLGKDFDHFIGGILRPVRLVAVPQNHFTTFHFTSELDTEYKDATLKVTVGAEGDTNKEIKFKLKDDQGVITSLSSSKVELGQEKKEATISIPIKNPKKWDAEHPNLYQLIAELYINNKMVETISKMVGFREIEMSGNKMLVNGQEVKLRGGNRHSIHPLAGRAYLEEIVEEDVKLYKESNINYIRTSHYPTSEKFLALCDKYGIYVEEEMAIVWLDHHASNGLLNGIASSEEVWPYFKTQISETLEKDKSHPSIIIWSIGNENMKWGTNFEKERDYARIADPTRPLKTGHNAYGGGWNTDEYLDIDSYHYPTWNSNFNKEGKPYLFDEYVHVLCYYDKNSTGERDPNARNFWGESMKRFWENMFPASGTLGGAIWGTIDDVFQSPNRINGYGYWGIFDGWRRKKPEYYLTKKAYSPIRIEDQPLTNTNIGQSITVDAKNWYDHTNFNELKITWEVGNENGTVTANIAPHKEGKIIIPATAWKETDKLYLKFESSFDNYTIVVDEYLLPLKSPVVVMPQLQEKPSTMIEKGDFITIKGEKFTILFDKKEGSIRSGIVNGEELIKGGPFLNLTPYILKPYSVTEVSTSTTDNATQIVVKGAYDKIGFNYILMIDNEGQMTVDYTVTNPPTDSNSYDEVGVYFLLTKDINQLDWNRNGLWSVYPKDHIGRNSGSTPKLKEGCELVYRKKPTWNWSYDDKDFLMRTKEHKGYGMSNDFRASKEYIYTAEAINKDTKNRLKVISDGKSQAVRMDFQTILPPVYDDGDPSVVYSGSWSAYNDGGDYNGTEHFSNQAGAYAEYTFNGSSVIFIGPKNNNLGEIDIYIDNNLMVENMDLYASSKQHQAHLYTKTELSKGEHKLKVVVKGTKNSASSSNYVVVDAFSAVEDIEENKEMRLNINRHYAYALGWGNYNRSSKITTGFHDKIWVQLCTNASNDQLIGIGSIENLSGINGEFQLISNQKGTGYYAVSTRSVPLEKEELKNAQSIELIANERSVVALSRLMPSMTYYLDYFVVDDNGNETAVSRLKFTTLISQIGTIEKGLDFKLYPNPTNDKLNIAYTLESATQLSIELVAIDGKKQLLQKNALCPAGNHHQTFDLKGYPNGRYFLLVNLNGKKEQIQIIKH